MMRRQQFPDSILAAAIVSTIASGCANANGTASQQAPSGTSGQQAKAQTKPPVKTMKIRLRLENTTLTATLDDNATARDFVSLLPLTMTLTDYGDNEKISDLPKKLSTQGAPEGMAPVAGDVTLYAPWGNLALFHKGGRYASGLVRMGRFDSGIEALTRPGPRKVTIERIER